MPDIQPAGQHKVIKMASKGTIILTGANGGLGSAIAHQIVNSAEFSAQYGVYTVRDTGNSPALSTELSSASTHDHDVLALDLTELDAVRSVAGRINVSFVIC
jgi:NAD(P)-dependent dehydrogenase (short-subunit alcohol dehydrogenase family)